jgi:hypothetical protein
MIKDGLITVSDEGGEMTELGRDFSKIYKMRLKNMTRLLSLIAKNL